jgi:hypothetical protein
VDIANVCGDSPRRTLVPLEPELEPYGLTVPAGFHPQFRSQRINDGESTALRAGWLTAERMDVKGRLGVMDLETGISLAIGGVPSAHWALLGSVTLGAPYLPSASVANRFALRRTRTRMRPTRRRATRFLGPVATLFDKARDAVRRS